MKDSSVSVVVRRRIRPELQDEFEVWLDGITKAAMAFEGHRGVQVLRPPDPEVQDYVVLFRFEKPEQLEAWDASPERAEWMARGERYTMGRVHIEHMTGLEFWFQIPAGKSPPPRYRMATATVVGLYPLIMFVVPLLDDLFSSFPKPLSVLFGTTITVALMTYAVMPLVTRLLRPWLFR